MLSEEEFAASILENPYIPHEPTMKQAEFLINDNPEGLYGGAAGGGKSDCLLMAGLQYVTESNFASLILRQSYTDLALPDAIMERAQQWLRGTDAKWRESTKTWYFPSGASLTFGYMENENDKYRYQGSAYQYIGMDELSQFTETQYLYLFSRLRRLENSYIPVRMRAASNPGGKGGDWVKTRFITYINTDGILINPPDELLKEGRFFVPAKLDDNPFLDREQYISSLEKLDPVTRAQLQYGDWDITPNGNMFKRESFKFVDEAPRNLTKLRFWDIAASEPTAGYKDPDYTTGLLMGTSGGLYYIIDILHKRLEPAERNIAIQATLNMDTPLVLQRMEREPGASGKDDIYNFAKDHFKGFNFLGVPSSGSKEVRARGFSGAVANGLVYLVRGPWNSSFINECCAFPQKGIHDDQVDAAAAAYNELIQLPIGLAYETTDINLSFSTATLRI